MGWNSGYRVFEATVIGAYDLGKLDKSLLKVLMEPYRNTDIDSGGSKNLLSHDGKDLNQIVIETWGLKMPTKITTSYKENPEAWESYHDEVYDKMREVTKYFGWS